MRYYLNTQGSLKLFKKSDLKEILDLDYLKRKAPKIYLDIVCRFWDDYENNKLKCIQIKLVIPNQGVITAFLSPILLNLILIEDYNYDLIDGRFNADTEEEDTIY